MAFPGAEPPAQFDEAAASPGMTARMDKPPGPENPASAEQSNLRQWIYLAALFAGYVGIYLCRKNLTVAVPMIQKTFGVNKAEVGAISSSATVAYMLGKIIFGPTIDKVGGRLSFFMSLAGVIVFGALGAIAGSLPMLTVFYTCNRFFGSAGWGSMVKQVPDWFSPRRLPLALAVLSMSFAIGGYCALYFAGWIATVSGESWRAVMAVPSIAVAGILLACWLILPKAKTPTAQAAKEAASQKSPWQKIIEVVRIPQFQVVCGLSFVLTIVRDFFNDWSVDFFKTAGGAATSTQSAAELSTSFDLAGAVGILFLGAILQRISFQSRRILLTVMLLCLGVLIYVLPTLANRPLWMASLVIGFIGFLSYGPYSLLAGVLSVEIKGKDYVATVAGFVDASGYLAGVLAGYPFGLILDRGGYNAGFHALAIASIFAVVLCLLLRNANQPEPALGTKDVSLASKP